MGHQPINRKNDFDLSAFAICFTFYVPKWTLAEMNVLVEQHIVSIVIQSDTDLKFYEERSFTEGFGQRARVSRAHCQRQRSP